MKRSFVGVLVSFILFHSNLLWAQTEDFENLRKLYVERKFESCLSKSEKYMNSDKTKKEALPYLYFSKCNYELSQSSDPEIIEYYPNALKDALKYALKFMQKDKDGTYLKIAEDYIPKLTSAYIAETKQIYDAASYNKASTNFKQLLKLIDDDNIRFAKGVCDAFNNNHIEARAELSQVIENYRNDKVAYYVANSEQILIDYTIDYTNYLLRSENVDSALSTINLIMEFRPRNSSLASQKEKIFNTIPVK